MTPTSFETLLVSIRQMRDHIRAMSIAEAALLYPVLAAEATRLCEGAGITDVRVQRFATDILDESIRRRHSGRALGT